MTSFNIASQKGELGEEIVTPYLESKGFIVYRPFTKGSHAFDGMAIKDKKESIAYDVKAKPRLKYIPGTGVDEKHFKTYSDFSKRHNMPFWIFFVDEHMGSVYGNEIKELEKPVQEGGRTFPYLINKETIRVWHLSSMITIGNITSEEQRSLVELSQRNYKYDFTPGGVTDGTQGDI